MTWLTGDVKTKFFRYFWEAFVFNAYKHRKKENYRIINTHFNWVLTKTTSLHFITPDPISVGIISYHFLLIWIWTWDFLRWWPVGIVSCMKLSCMEMKLLPKDVHGWKFHAWSYVPLNYPWQFWGRNEIMPGVKFSFSCVKIHAWK